MYSYDFGFAVGVGGEVYDFGARCSLREVVLFVAYESGGGKAFHIIVSGLAVTVDYIIYSSSVLLAEDGDMQGVGADEHFLGDLDGFIFTIFIEDDDIVDIGARAEVLVVFERGSDEAVLSVDIQFLVGFDNGIDIDVGEVANLGESWMVGTILLFE